MKSRERMKKSCVNKSLTTSITIKLQGIIHETFRNNQDLHITGALAQGLECQSSCFNVDHLESEK